MACVLKVSSLLTGGLRGDKSVQVKKAAQGTRKQTRDVFFVLEAQGRNRTCWPNTNGQHRGGGWPKQGRRGGPEKTAAVVGKVSSGTEEG